MGAPCEVSFDHTSFRYAGSASEAIREVGLIVREGEFLLVTGASGSGKTTLARCVNGLVPHFHEGDFGGEVRVAGKDTRDLDVGAIGTMVGSVFQDPRSQFFMTDTTSEVAFGCANASLPRDEVWHRVDGAFDRLGIGRLRDRSVFELSSGEMQQVAVASCYALGPSVYVFDEPSANLDMCAVERLRRIMRELKDEGKTVVVLEHRLFYLKDLLDRMAVVEGGTVSRLCGRDEALALSDDDLALMGLRGFHPEKLRARGAMPRQFVGEAPKASAVLTFEVSNLEFSYRRRTRRKRRAYDDARRVAAVGPLSFRARGGEVVGIVGCNGAGKTTLARLCCGLLREDAGTVALDGRALGRKERWGAVRLIMQDSDYQLFSDSVLGELSIGKKGAPKAAEDVLKRMDLWSKRDDHPAALSRGQKQRLTIASAIVDDSRVLFFDEPTSGLDERNMQVVTLLLRELASEGGLVFVISHDYEFLLAACSRVLHVEGGCLVDDFPLSDATRRRLADALWEGGAPWNGESEGSIPA